MGIMIILMVVGCWVGMIIIIKDDGWFVETLGMIIMIKKWVSLLKF